MADSESEGKVKERLKGKAVPVIVATSMLFILDIMLAVYHFTHEGKGSGRTELVAAPVIIIPVSLGVISRREENKSSRWRLIRRIVSGLLLISALLYMFLAIYHLSHQGLRSGLMESGIAVLLLFILYCIWPQLKNRRPVKGGGE